MNNGCGEKLVTLAAAISIQIAQCVTEDELAILAELFTVIGDQLSLLAVANPLCCPNSSKKVSPKQETGSA
ncbi:DUF6774 domain-containing protein [Caproiciproducens sp.]